MSLRIILARRPGNAPPGVASRFPETAGTPLFSSAAPTMPLAPSASTDKTPSR
jgi:hypothetical protein